MILGETSGKNTQFPNCDIELFFMRFGKKNFAIDDFQSTLLRKQPSLNHLHHLHTTSATTK